MAVIKDGDWTLFDWNQQLGRTVWRLEDGENKVHYRTDYDVTATMKENKFTRDQNLKFGEWDKIASIPLNIFYDCGFYQAHLEGDRKWTKRWLNDGDNRAWRTMDGVI